METGTPNTERKRPRQRLARLLPVVAGVVFLLFSLGLTCEEYLEFPSVSEGPSPVYTVSGTWSEGAWFIDIQGDAAYDANYLGGFIQGVPKPHPVKLAFWEVLSVAMRIGAWNPDLWMLEAQPTGNFQFILTAELDIYGYNDTIDDWEKETGEPLVGVNYYEGQMVAGEECAADDDPSGPFQPPKYWRVYCGEVPTVSAAGADTVHVNAGYGDLELAIKTFGCWFFSCDPQHWKHRIP